MSSATKLLAALQARVLLNNDRALSTSNPLIMPDMLNVSKKKLLEFFALHDNTEYVEVTQLTVKYTNKTIDFFKQFRAHVKIHELYIVGCTLYTRIRLSLHLHYL